MSSPRRNTWLVLICLGVGIALAMVIRNLIPASPANPLRPQPGGVDEPPVGNAGSASDDGATSLSGEQRHAPAPSPGPVARPPRVATPAVEAPNAAEDTGVPPNGERVYTMNTLPRNKSGIYWVRDPDGKVTRIAVDVPGEDSPIGVLDSVR